MCLNDPTWRVWLEIRQPQNIVILAIRLQARNGLWNLLAFETKLEFQLFRDNVQDQHQPEEANIEGLILRINETFLLRDLGCLFLLNHGYLGRKMCFENLELIIFSLKGSFFLSEKACLLPFLFIAEKKITNIPNIGLKHEFAGKELSIGNYLKDLKDETS